MNGRNRMMRTIGAALAFALVAGPVQAATSNDAALSDTVRQLQAEIENLRADNTAMDQKLSRIEAQSDTSWLNQRRAEEVKALVHEVLADADTRASLLQDGMTAGHNGKHFFLASADGSFLLEVSGQIQLRYVYNERDHSHDDDGEFGMEVRRTKIQFAGHVASPKLHYAVRLAIDPNNNSVFGDKITIGYDVTDDLYLWAGEDTAPFLREEITSSSRQLAVERSLINEFFTVDKVQGIGMVWSSDMVKVSGMINDGAHSGDRDGTLASTGFYGFGFDDFDLPFDPDEGEILDYIYSVFDFTGAKGFSSDYTDFAATGRIDVMVMGNWNQMDDFSSWAGEEMAVFIGGALHYEVGETGSSAPNYDVLLWTIDASVEVDGLNVYLAYVGANIDADAGGDEPSPWGIVAQAGYNIPLSSGDSVEPFARWEHLDVDASHGSDDEVDIVTVGANYYFNRHNAKLTADVVWALDPIGAPATDAGLLEDSFEGSDDQFALRVQFQLLW
jgi:outer membrane murein-binding lipoprotein Lpp